MEQLKEFDIFKNREVKVIENENEVQIQNRTIQISDFKLASDEKLIDEIQKKASDLGLSFRLWLPNTVGTMDLKSDRLNVVVAKQQDNKFTISNIYLG